MIRFFEELGITALGSRLRWLAEELTRNAIDIYKMYGLEIKPKWFPVLYMLYNSDDHTVTGIAKAIGQTHPSVSTIVRELKDAGFVTYDKSESDHRTTAVNLTDKGKDIESAIRKVCEDVKRAAEAIEKNSDHKLWNAISTWESALEEKSFVARVADVKKQRYGQEITIVDYRPEYLMTFKRLNIMWINSHWSLETHDLEVLNDPDASILSKGGYIFVALVNGKPTGVVALCRMEQSDYDYEIAKLAVAPEIRGIGLGKALLRAAIEKAKSLGARKLFLESNTLLTPAIGLYRNFGFKELKDYHPAYARGDIQMELILN